MVLTKPLAYKGPTDHLSQFFTLAELYAGMQILQQDLLVDWKDQRQNGQVQGVFLEQGQLIKTYLDWPLDKVSKTSVCDLCASQSGQGVFQPCGHISALAIASKMHLERLPQPLRQTLAFESEWAYLCDWFEQQSFDPYPAMARHRVIYLLDSDEKGYTISIHKAYLTQEDTYQRKAELDLSVMEKLKLPKFVSLTDQQILNQIQLLIKREKLHALSSNTIALQFPQCGDLLRLILGSGRCFWQNCYRQALSLQNGSCANEQLTRISDELCLDKAHSRMLDFTALMPLEKLERLQTHIGDGADIEYLPCLTIASEQIYFSWQRSEKQTQSLDIDVARVSFKIGGDDYEFEELIAGLKQLGLSKGSLVEAIAARIHQIDWIPSIAAYFEQPVAARFGAVDRYLNGDFSHWFVLFYGLQYEGWQVKFESQFRLHQKSIESWYSRVSASSQEADTNEWFELEIGVMIEGQSVNVLPYVVEALKRNQWDFDSPTEEMILTLADGTRIVLAKKRLQTILDNLIELTDNRPLSSEQQLRLPISQFSRLQLLSDELEYAIDWQNAEWLKDKSSRLAACTPITVVIPGNIHAQLRDYQLKGVHWLQFLRSESLAGILADDMGLGKTLQALTHIQLEKNADRMKAPAMVVAPTSLLGNWVAEAKKFTPELELVQWYGADRQKQAHRLAEADLIVTSYGVLLRDAELLNRLGLYLLVLDEAQTIKNARSRIARITYAMSARYRLCLTGTPLENHLGELWSLFHFLMPGFLGDESQFKRLFRVPIEKENDFQRQQVLAQRIAPFMLRRTKDKVARDLPKKTEINESIELSETQADLYESVRLSMMEEVQHALTQSSRGSNQLLIGNALLRLRQICCHPSLLKKEGLDNSVDSSAKLNWLQTMLPEMIAAKRKILLFSSFTSMLDIVADLLQELKIDYLMLTGKSRRRTELVEKFQTGDMPVFLISLKAGGAGLNLTAADTVIHFDPWWNPAAENQASDRAHRIGQDKPVFVYKLITRGTLEERIHKMQEKKQALADQLYERQNDDVLVKADWEKLLAPIE